MRYYILEPDGEIAAVTSMKAWGEWFNENHEARIVAKTKVGDAEVSTVFLGIDHSFGGADGGAPILFETLIFDGPHDGWMRRYATKANAQAGHARAVEALRAGRNPDDEPSAPSGRCGESVPQAYPEVPPNAGSAS